LEPSLATAVLIEMAKDSLAVLIGPALLAVLISVATLTIFNILGIMLAKFPIAAPLLPRSAMKGMARIVSNVCLPALMFIQFGTSLSVERLKTAWYLGAFSLVNLAVSLSSGLVLRCIACPPPRFARGMLMALTFQNALALPLLLVEVLARQPVIIDSIPDAVDQGYTYVFCFLIGNVPMLWTGCYSFLESDPVLTAQKQLLGERTEEVKNQDPDPGNMSAGAVVVGSNVVAPPDDGGEDERPLPESTTPLPLPPPPLPLPPPPQHQRSCTAACCRSWTWNLITFKLRKAFCNPAFVTMAIACAIALVPPLKSYVFVQQNTPLQPFVSVIKILGTASVPVTTLVMGGTLGHAFWLRCTVAACKRRCCCCLDKRRDDAPNESLREVEMTTTAEGDECIPIEEVKEAEEVAQAEEEEGEADEFIPWWPLVVLVFGKMVIIPSIQTAVVILIGGLFLPEDPILRLVLCLECCVPSANMVIVFSQQFGNRVAAEGLATR